MIGAFLDSWSLFGVTYGVGILAAFVLAQLGIWVVARNQIFLGAAVAQASTLGIALALFAGGLAGGAADAWLDSGVLPAALAVAASLATAWVVTRPRGAQSESAEAVNGWVFLVASSVPVLLLAHSPHGLEEIQRLMFSTLLTAGTGDLAAFAALAVGGTAATAALGAPLLLFSVDPDGARSLGLLPPRWRAFSAVWLGLAVGVAIHAAGTLFTFGCLVLPALAAKGLCREVRTMAWVAPLLAAAAALLGFFFGNSFDVPPAHATVALLGAAVAGTWVRRR